MGKKTRLVQTRMDIRCPAQTRVLRSAFSQKTRLLVHQREKVKRLKTTIKKPVSCSDGNKKDIHHTKHVGNTRRRRLSPTHAVSETKQENKKTFKSSVWSIKERHEYNIQLPLNVDEKISWISGCFLHHTGEIIVIDFFNCRLKKLDRKTQKVSKCDLSLPPVAMCYIGADIVVISLGRKLQFSNISGNMKLTNTIDLEYNCKGMVFHNSKIFTVNENSVFMHNVDGKLIRCLYRHHSRDAYFQDINFSSSGTTMYISSWNIGLVIVSLIDDDTSVCTLCDEEMTAPFGVCRDENDNVFVCLPWQKTIIQVSSDGKKKLGEIIKKVDRIPAASLYFDCQTNSLIVGCGGSGKLYVLELC